MDESVGAVGILREDEHLGVLQAGDDQLAHLRGGFAAGEPVHVDALDGKQLRQESSSARAAAGATRLRAPPE
jgi:hypothetical protein